MSKFIISGLFIGITVISLGNKLLVLVIDIFNRFVVWFNYHAFNFK